MPRQKILFLSPWYPTRENPVQGSFVQEYAKAVRIYHDVSVLHCGAVRKDLRTRWHVKQETDPELTQGIPTWRILYRSGLVSKRGPKYGLYLWSVLRGVREILSQGFHPAILHAHVYQAGLPAVLVGRILRLPVVVSEHFSAFLRRDLPRRERRKARLAFGGASFVLPVSRALQRAIEQYGIQARFCVVPNVVDTSSFFPDPRISSCRHERRLLFVGLLDPSHQKGVPLLLEACALLNKAQSGWRLDIIGDGPPREQYERKARELGLSERVRFHGLKSKKEVARFMQRADLFMLPSLLETFSVVSAEALCTGTPVLATRCGGPEEFVSGAVGLLVPPNDTMAIYTGLCSLLERLDHFDPYKISHYGWRLFSSHRVGEQLDSIYSACLERQC